MKDIPFDDPPAVQVEAWQFQAPPGRPTEYILKMGPWSLVVYRALDVDGVDGEPMLQLELSTERMVIPLALVDALGRLDLGRLAPPSYEGDGEA